MLQKKVSGCFSVGPVRKPKILPVEDNAWCLFIGRYFHRIGSTTLDFVKKKNLKINEKSVFDLQHTSQYACRKWERCTTFAVCLAICIWGIILIQNMEVLLPPTHSPDFASMDYHHFWLFQHFLGRRQYNNYEDVRNNRCVLAWKLKEFYAQSVNHLSTPLDYIVENEGKYYSEDVCNWSLNIS